MMQKSIKTIKEKRSSKRRVEMLFRKMVGCRFKSYEVLEHWFHRALDEKFPDLSISDCDGINAEIDMGMTEVDYSADCTFGEKLFGMAYADFTISYILDNEKKMYVTAVDWS